MKTSRREFLKISGLTCSAVLAGTFRLNAFNSNNSKEVFAELSKKASTFRGSGIGDCVINIAESFVGKPYLGGTLDDYDGGEKLVYTFDGFDCVTLCETSLALARCIYGRGISRENFEAELKKIRYRSGKLEEFPSRLHYTSIWIKDNEAKGIIRDISKEIGGTAFNAKVGYMSTHADSYKALRENPRFISSIKKMETEINTSGRFYIEKSKVAGIEKKLRNGDIFAITTNKSGLDYSHMGLCLCKNGGTPRLLHASSAKHVVTADVEISSYLSKVSSATGISVLRPL